MTQYYAKKLAGVRLRRCYEIAPPRAAGYLEAEIDHLRGRIQAGDHVLELGCGYGRVTARLADHAARVVGVDVADESLDLARQSHDGCEYRLMDALALDFPDGTFDVVACVQNGICAFRVDQVSLAREAWRVLRPGGRLLISTYSDTFWPHRLEWFEQQAVHGLIGSLDRAACQDGTIVCADGFRSGRATREQFQAIALALGVEAIIDEVDESSLWCEIRKPT